MIDALRYEYVRLRTIRSTYWLVGGALALQLVLAMVIGWQLSISKSFGGGDDSFDLLATIGGSTGAPLLTAYIVGMIGVFSTGHEYRHGMIRATLTAIPDRRDVFFAKLISTAVVAAATSVACILIAFVGIFVFGLDLPTSGGFFTMSAGLVVYTMLFALSGLAYAAITRNQTSAVALLVLVPSLVEFIVQSIVILIKTNSSDPRGEGGIASILKFLPYDAGSQMYVQASVDGLIQRAIGAVPFGPVGGGIVMAVFVGALLAGAYALFQRRDA